MRFSVSSRCNLGESCVEGNTLVTCPLAFTATSTGMTLGLKCVSDMDDAMATPPDSIMAALANTMQNRFMGTS
ncbi:hypothetical protein UU5_00795 [Rhodanobacter sp. 115]|nr:hypothetical protein UU5_00795 [Rhodanobacter sp. 115]